MEQDLIKISQVRKFVKSSGFRISSKGIKALEQILKFHLINSIKEARSDKNKTVMSRHFRRLSNWR